MPKISDLPVATSVSGDDLVPIVDAPDGGSAVTQHAKLSDIVALATTSLAGVTWQGVWSGATTYANAAVVSYNGSTYISLQATNLNHTPSAAGVANAWWQMWVAQGPAGTTGAGGDVGATGADGIPKTWLSGGTWIPGTYARGTVVSYNGSSYVATQTPSSTTVPTDTSQWALLSSKGDIGPRSWNAPTAWVTAHAYLAGTSSVPADSVTMNGNFYMCIVSHTSGTFATDLSANKWALVVTKGDPGVVAAVIGTAPVIVDATTPGSPIVSVTTNVSNSVTPTLLRLDKSGRVPYNTLQNRVLNHIMVGETAGSSYHNFLQSNADTEGEAISSNTYVATLVIPADTHSIVQNVAVGSWYRDVQLHCNVMMIGDTSASRTCMFWRRQSDGAILSPTFRSYEGTDHTCVFTAWDHMRGAGIAETYRLYAYKIGFQNDFSFGYVSPRDLVSASVYPCGNYTDFG